MDPCGHEADPGRTVAEPAATPLPDWAQTWLQYAPSVLLAFAWGAVLYIYWSACFVLCPPHYVRSLRDSADGERQLVVPASILLATLVLAALAAHAVSLGELVTSAPAVVTLERVLRAAPPLVLLVLTWSLVVHALLAGPQALLERGSWPGSAIPVLGGAAAAAQGAMLFAIGEASENRAVVGAAAVLFVVTMVWITIAMAWGLLTSYPGRYARLALAVVLLAAMGALAIWMSGESDTPRITWHSGAKAPNWVWALDQSEMRTWGSSASETKGMAAHLEALLADEDPTARFCAAYAVGCLNEADSGESREALSRLSGKLRQGLEAPTEVPAVRCACAYALGQLPKTEKVKMSLLCGAKADDEGVRWAALRSLGVKELRGDAIAEGVVEQGLRDPSLLVREEAKAVQARWSPAASSKSNAGPPAGLREDRGAPD